MEHLNTVLCILGVLILALGSVSKLLEKSPLPPTVLALVIGVVLGPEVTGVLDLTKMGEQSRILEGVTRVTLAIGLVGVALRVPREYTRKHWREMIVLITGAMVLMFGICTALVYYILGLSFWMAALVGAIITATDPIAASPIVTGPTAEKNLPERIRHAISFESGANDGLSYLFVFMPFLIMTKADGEAVKHWFSRTLLYEVGVATIFGILLGWVAARILRWAEKHDVVAESWRLVYTVALALAAVGAGKLIGSDEVLMVFAAGVAFTQVVSSSDRVNEDRGQEAVDRFFSIPVFTVLGAAIPWDGWASLGWNGILLAIAVLLLRRVPVLLLLRPGLRSVRSVPDALFVGWFGPIAIAAIYYAAMMEHKLHAPLIWHIVSLVICASVVLHGITAGPLTRLYGRHTAHAK